MRSKLLLYCLFLVSLDQSLSVETVESSTDLPNVEDTTQGEELSTETPLYGEIKSENYPSPYPSEGDWNWTISFPEGYGIELTLEDLDIDGGSNDFLTIGTANGDDKGRLFTWHIDKPRKMKIVNSNSLFVRFVAQHGTGAHAFKGFRITYKRDGVVTTTEPPSTTTTPLPTVAPDIPTPSLRVSMVGLTPERFLNVSEEFKDILAGFANTFCENKGIELENEVTSTNVVLLIVTRCPRTWPSYNNCVQIEFSIPVFKKNNTDEENNVTAPTDESENSTDDDELKNFELSHEHLEELWLKYRNSFKELGILPYDKPDDQFVIWIGISLAILVMFLAVLYCIWNSALVRDYNRTETEYDDRQSIISTGKEARFSSDTLFPGPHQLVPPLFSQDSDYPSYEREWGGPVHPLNNTSSPPIYRSESYRHSLPEKPDDVYISQNISTDKVYHVNNMFVPEDDYSETDDLKIPVSPVRGPVPPVVLRGMSHEESNL